MATGFGGPVPGGFAWVIFALLLATACVSDLRTRRIPNPLVLVTAIAGVAVTIAMLGVLHGAGRALGGMGVGLALWLPFWLLGMMGAGDVKLFAAGAAWLGPSGAFEGALLAAIAGGVLSFVYLLFQHGLSFTVLRLAQGVRHPGALRQTAPSKWDRRMPYALAMAFGLLLAAWRPGILI